MRSIILGAALIALLALVAHQLMPWYAILVSGLVVGIALDPGAATGWWAGFLAGLLLWGGYATAIYLGNEGLLAGRVGELFGGLPGPALLALTALLGALAGGLGALTGALARRSVAPRT